MTREASATLRWRVHRVIAELDARGEIDVHAAMCLRQAIGAARESTIELVLVDLRDLTAIDTGGLALLTRQSADCRAHGVQLGLLIGGPERERIAEALVLAGLGDTLRYPAEPLVAAGADLAEPRGRAPAAAKRRLASPFGHVSRGSRGSGAA